MKNLIQTKQGLKSKNKRINNLKNFKFKLIFDYIN